jgi:hypothetical protein
MRRMLPVRRYHGPPVTMRQQLANDIRRLIAEARITPNPSAMYSDLVELISNAWRERKATHWSAPVV